VHLFKRHGHQCMKWQEPGHHVVGYYLMQKRRGEGWDGTGLDGVRMEAELPLFPLTSTLQFSMHALTARYRHFQDCEDVSFDSSNAYQKIISQRCHLLDQELEESAPVILRTIKKAHPGEGIRRTVLRLQ
jgi:hypothetical protein